MQSSYRKADRDHQVSVSHATPDRGRASVSSSASASLASSSPPPSSSSAAAISTNQQINRNILWANEFEMKIKQARKIENI